MTESVVADDQPTSSGLFRQPNARRHVANLVPMRPFRVTRVNTVVAPSVDMAFETVQINAGFASPNAQSEFSINQRIYRAHDGTLYPVSGAGCEQLNRTAFRILGILNHYRGWTPEARLEVRNMGMVNRDDIAHALRVWRKWGRR